MKDFHGRMSKDSQIHRGEAQSADAGVGLVGNRGPETVEGIGSIGRGGVEEVEDHVEEH